MFTALVPYLKTPANMSHLLNVSWTKEFGFEVFGLNPFYCMYQMSWKNALYICGSMTIFRAVKQILIKKKVSTSVYSKDNLSRWWHQSVSVYMAIHVTERHARLIHNSTKNHEYTFLGDNIAMSLNYSVTIPWTYTPTMYVVSYHAAVFFWPLTWLIRKPKEKKME